MIQLVRFLDVKGGIVLISHPLIVGGGYSWILMRGVYQGAFQFCHEILAFE